MTEPRDADVCPVCGHKQNAPVPLWAKVVGGVFAVAALIVVLLAIVWLIQFMWGAIS
jgi:hypothetical protein